MKYQVIGLTKNEEYDACREVLECHGLTLEPGTSRIPPFDTRDEAIRLLEELRITIPTAPLGIEEIPDDAS